MKAGDRDLKDSLRVSSARLLRDQPPAYLRYPSLTDFDG
jgi:hypothetical protein